MEEWLIYTYPYNNMGNMTTMNLPIKPSHFHAMILTDYQLGLLEYEVNFRHYCRINDLMGALNIYSLYNHIDVDFNDHECFHIVAQHGNIVFLKWLYSLSKQHIKYPERVIKTVCENGDLEILKWMHEVGITQGVCMKSAYFCAVRNHDIKLADWLIDTFPNFNKGYGDEDYDLNV